MLNCKSLMREIWYDRERVILGMRTYHLCSAYIHGRWWWRDLGLISLVCRWVCNFGMMLRNIVSVIHKGVEYTCYKTLVYCILLFNYRQIPTCCLIASDRCMHSCVTCMNQMRNLRVENYRQNWHIKMTDTPSYSIPNLLLLWLDEEWNRFEFLETPVQEAGI